MEDVLDVYARPYNPQRPQVCLDEGGKELRDTPNGTIPMQPGQPAREDYEYERLGKANLFLWVEPLAGRRRVLVTERHTACDFADALKVLVDEEYPDADKIVLVTDNLNIHKAASLYERFEPEEAHRIANRIEWHYTPEHGSWLNMASANSRCWPGSVYLGAFQISRRCDEKRPLGKSAATAPTLRSTGSLLRQTLG